MLDKILRISKTARSVRHDPPGPALQPELEEKSAALKIVHAGGKVECYFMAIPAKRIMDKHPSCYLTRPDVFRRPWESVVRPDQILNPGEKFFIVPRRTVRKLCRIIRKPGARDAYAADHSSIMQSINNVADQSCDGMSSNMINKPSDVSCSFSGIMRKRQAGGTKKHVRFFGIEEKLKKGPLNKAEEKATKNVVEKQNSKGYKVVQLNGENRKLRRSGIWQPSLSAITERHGPNE